jgi:serine protease inhibitor
VDYQRASEEARKQINKWVSDKTENKINDIIQPGTFDNLTRLVLVNAVCFKGRWDKPFEKRRTEDAPFHLSSSKSVKVPMMTQEKYFDYVDTGDGLQILELPYVGSDLSMLVLLPKEIDGLEQLESRLSFESLKNRRRSLKNSEVIVFLPKFRMTSAFGLNAVLQKMGMVNAFDMGKADFAGMNGRN